MIGRHSAVALLVVSLVLPGCGGKVAAPTPLEPAPSPAPTWTNLGLTSSYSQAYALLSDGSRLVAGGAIHDALGRARIAVALWDGGAWSAPVSQPRATVEALASYGGELIAATPTDTGQFIHRFDGQKWSPLGGGMSGPAIALARYGNGLVCGGSFIKAGGTPASFIAYWDGATWKNLGLGVSNPVYALAVYRGDLIAAGRFWSAGGQPAAYIARWDGAAWHPMGAGMDAIVTTLAVHGETLVAGGYFRTAGGVQVNGVALWDGSAWSALGEGVLREAGNAVFSVASYQGDVVAGGSFDGFVARWRGGRWTVMPGLDGSVEAMTVHDGALFAAGFFRGAVASWRD